MKLHKTCVKSNSALNVSNTENFFQEGALLFIKHIL